MNASMKTDQTLTFAVIANLEPNSNFQLERKRAIEYVLGNTALSHEFINISDIKRLYDLEGIDAAENQLFQQVSHYNCIITHKEIALYVRPRFFARLKNKGVYIVGFIGDEDWDPIRNSNFIDLFNLSAVYTKSSFKYFSERGSNVIYFPEGSVFDLPYDNYELSIGDLSVVFIGRPYHPRPKIISYLLENGINLKIYGDSQWLKYIPKKFYYGFVDNHEYYDVLRQNHIILALMESPNSLNVHSNTKIFDAAKAGRMAICTYSSNLEKEYGLSEDESVVFYRSPKELLQKILYYGRDKEKLISIAQNQSKKISSQFDYRKLYLSLISHIQRAIINFKPTNPSCSSYSLTPKDWNRLDTQWKFINIRGNTSVDLNLLNIIKYYEDNLDIPLVLNPAYNNKILLNKLPIVHTRMVLVHSKSRKPFSLLGYAIIQRKQPVSGIPTLYFHDKCASLTILAYLNIIISSTWKILRTNKSV